MLGDGIIDATAALQNRIDLGNCFIPKTSAFYKITKPLVVPSNCQITSDGAYIKNVSTGTPAGWAGATGYWDNVFSVGNYGGETDDNYGALWILDYVGVVANHEDVVVHPASGTYSIGDIVFLRSSTNFVATVDGKNIPRYVMTNKIVGVSGNSVTLKYPCNHNFDLIAVGGGFTGLDGNPAYIAEGVYIQGLKLESLNANNWSVMHISSLGTIIEDIEIVASSHGIGANPFAFSSMKNISVNGITSCELPAVEVTNLSNNSNLSNITIGKGQINISECGSFIDLDGFSIGDGFIGTARKHDVTIKNGVVTKTTSNSLGGASIILARETENDLLESVSVLDSDGLDSVIVGAGSTGHQIVNCTLDKPARIE